MLRIIITVYSLSPSGDPDVYYYLQHNKYIFNHSVLLIVT